MADIDLIEHLLCERYNVASLDGLGRFPEAVRRARTGNVGDLKSLLSSREMYRWREPIEAALAAESTAAEVPEAETDTVADAPAETSAAVEPEPEAVPAETPAAGEPAPESQQPKPQPKSRSTRTK